MNSKSRRTSRPHPPKANNILLSVLALASVGLAVFVFTGFSLSHSNAPVVAHVRVTKSPTPDSPAVNTKAPGYAVVEKLRAVAASGREPVLAGLGSSVTAGDGAPLIYTPIRQLGVAPNLEIS